MKNENFPREMKFKNVTLKKTFVSRDLAEELYNNWGSDPEVFKNITSKPINSLEKTMEVLEKSKEASENGKFFRYVIFYNNEASGFLTLTPKTIGNNLIIGINNEEKSIIDDYDAMEIGLSLGSKFWNKGIGSKSFNAILSNMRFDKELFATVSENNPASNRLLEKSGFKLRSFCKRKDIHKDTEIDPDKRCFFYMYNKKTIQKKKKNILSI